MKQRLRKLISLATRFFCATRIGEAVLEVFIQSGMDRVQGVSNGGVSLRFAVPNRINRFRAKSFATKEPETLDWIDRMPKGCTLWDIGANVGLYSVYAAKKRECRVVAFEPSVFNLELLARNLFLNGLQDRVSIVPLALSDKLAVNQLRMTSTEWGGALSTFGQNYGWDGKTLAQTFSFSTLGISMDEGIRLLQLPTPDFIKMDVDGIEHIILRGGSGVLSRIRGMLIEINDGFEEQATEAEQILRTAGLCREAKLHASMIADSPFTDVYNQIWTRK